MSKIVIALGKQSYCMGGGGKFLKIGRETGIEFRKKHLGGGEEACKSGGRPEDSRGAAPSRV